MRNSCLLLAGVATIAAASSACAQSVSRFSPPLAQSVTLGALTIAPGELPSAMPGKVLTLTVDGIQHDLVPGQYTGNVMLNVTDDIAIQYHKLPVHHFRTALFVEDGTPVAAKSVLAAVRNAEFGAHLVAGARISSQGERFNGIMVTGAGKYTIDRPIIDFVGNGGNDFAGFGAAIMATGNADVWINRPIIRTRGAIRTALFTGGHATMHVDGAEIEVLNGALPADYKFTVDVGRMMEVPWMLGLSGNVRASNLVDFGTLHLSHSHVRAQGWGAISTDDNTRVRMYVSDSLIETVDSGYGCYSIGDSVDSFERSVIRSADIGCIMAANGSVTFTDHTLVESGKYGVMMHSGAGGGTLAITNGSALEAKEAAIEIKGIGTTIVIDNASVSSGNHTIVQAMENDDPFMKAMMSGHIPEGMTAPPPGAGGPPASSGPTPSPDVVANLRNTALVGDFWNGRTHEGGMRLVLEHASVTGVISTSTTASASGQEPTRATYREIGRVTNSASATTTANGLSVTLDGTSRWVVTGTSYLTALAVAPGAAVVSPDGAPASLMVDGKRIVLGARAYTGKIVVSPR